MGKHRGQPADEPGADLVWGEGEKGQRDADNFDAYDQYLKDNAPEDNNPYSKENFKG